MSTMLAKFGIRSEDIQSEPMGFESTGRVLLLDGDSYCYELAAKYKQLETMLRHYETRVREVMFLTKSDAARVHLTPKGCHKNGRHLLNTVKPYQGNRQGKPKPPLLEQLRGSLEHYFSVIPDIMVFNHYDIEADDALMIDTYAIPNTCLVSADKDLQIACTPSYCMTDYIETRLPQGNRFGQIYETMTTGGKFKVKGKGTSFFWWQMLAGDKADNVQGIQKYLGKLCGDVGAYNALASIRCEHEAANLVLSGYMDIDQNPLPEAAALWLLRAPNDTAEGYIASLNLNNDVRSFINDCYQREWKREASTEVSESAASCDSEAD